MKYSFFTSAVLLVGLIVACDGDDQCCANIDTSISISVKNEDGLDLLDPQNPGAFQEEVIKIFYLTDGKVEEHYEPNRDAPRGFSIYKESAIDRYAIQVYPNDDVSEEFPVTYIRWNTDDTDTIKCEYQRTENAVVCTKVWFNDEIKWEAYETGRYFEIIK